MEFGIAGIILTLIGFWVGYKTSIRSGRYIQDRQFQKEEADKKNILRSLLLTLRNDIADYYARLANLRILLPSGGGVREYFNLANKDAIWPELVKSSIFSEHREIFNRINRMSQRIYIINQEIILLQDIVAGRAYSSTTDKYTNIRLELDYLRSIVDDIINQDIIESSGKPELVIRLDEIIKKI